jgi:malonate transporter and related proteins
VLYFALPCMLFRFGASLPLAQLIDARLVGVYAVCAVAVVAIAVWIARAQRVDMKNAAFGALVAAFPNSGLMGVPLLVALFGEAAAGPVIGTLLVDLFLTSTLCLALAQAGDERRRSGADATLSPSRADATPARLHAEVASSGSRAHTPSSHSRAPALFGVVTRSLRAAATNPQPWAIGLGALAAALPLRLPAPLAQVVKMLADSAAPVALFTIGAVLWRAGQHASTRTPLRAYLPIALVKLFVHPLLVGLAGLALRAAGADVPPFGLAMLVLAAALPSASNVSLLAERDGADNGRVARIIMASTVLAFASFSLIAAVIGRHVIG